MPTWQPAGCGVTAGGDTGGDCQAGESWAVHYVDHDSVNTEEKRVVYIYFYPEQRGDTFVVTRQTEMIVCRDVDHPGQSEIWADYAYHTYPETYRQLSDAEAHARRRAERHRAADVDWDGSW